MELMVLFLTNRREQESITDVSKKFEDMVINCPRIVPLLKDPFYLVPFTREIPTSIKPLGGPGSRAYVVNNKFVYKYDEQEYANELSFATNIFAKACGIKTVDMIISVLEYFIQDGQVHEFTPTVTQIMQYIPEWQDYTPDHPKDHKFVKQLAELLAFDLTVGNGDRFLFISRYIDDFLFKDDPEYDPYGEDLWDNPIINEGNFGIVNDDLWSLDERAYDDINYITRLHALLTEPFLDECTRLMGYYFKLTPDQMLLFRRKLVKYLDHDLALFPIFHRLHKWVISGLD